MEVERGYAVVEMHSRNLIIVGKVLVTEKEFRRGRLSDYVNRAEVSFVPVNDARIIDVGTKEKIDEKKFMLVNKNAIDWIIPIKEPKYKYGIDSCYEL